MVTEISRMLPAIDRPTNQPDEPQAITVPGPRPWMLDTRSSRSSAGHSEECDASRSLLDRFIDDFGARFVPKVPPNLGFSRTLYCKMECCHRLTSAHICIINVK